MRNVTFKNALLSDFLGVYARKFKSFFIQIKENMGKNNPSPTFHSSKGAIFLIIFQIIVLILYTYFYRLEEFALAESKDQGKPVKLARNMDITRASYNFRTFAQAWQVKDIHIRIVHTKKIVI